MNAPFTDAPQAAESEGQAAGRPEPRPARRHGGGTGRRARPGRGTGPGARALRQDGRRARRCRGTGPRRPSPPRSLALLGSRALARLARGDRDRARRWRRHGVLGPQSAPADRRGHARARDSRAGEREHGALRRAAVERGRVGLRPRVHGRVALPDRKREPRGRLDVQARRRPLHESTGADGPPAADDHPRRGRGGSAGARLECVEMRQDPDGEGALGVPGSGGFQHLLRRRCASCPGCSGRPLPAPSAPICRPCRSPSRRAPSRGLPQFPTVPGWRPSD